MSKRYDPIPSFLPKKLRVTADKKYKKENNVNNYCIP